MYSVAIVFFTKGLNNLHLIPITYHKKNINVFFFFIKYKCISLTILELWQADVPNPWILLKGILDSHFLVLAGNLIKGWKISLQNWCTHWDIDPKAMLNGERVACFMRHKVLAMMLKKTISIAIWLLVHDRPTRCN